MHLLMLVLPTYMAMRKLTLSFHVRSSIRPLTTHRTVRTWHTIDQ